MSAFSQTVKFQDDSDYNRPCNYSPRQTSRQSLSKSMNHKYTNTPSEFMCCLKCKDKITKKNQHVANCAVGDCDRNLSEYTKALNYINSCHSIINEMMTNQDGFNFKMPDLPNFMNIFNSLSITETTNGDAQKIPKKSMHESRLNNQLFEGRTRSHSNENRCISPKVTFKQPISEEQLKQTTKGKFIELLPDMEHGRKSKSQGNISPGTTESEESDIEMNIVQKTGRVIMSKKFKSKIKAMHEKVIYEEDSHEEDSASADKPNVEQKNVTRKTSPIIKPQNSLVPQRKSLHGINTPASVPCNSANTNDKKTKQRSSSSVTPREKTKLCSSNKSINQDVTGNFSDTAITARSNAGQNRNKFGQKGLCAPTDLRNKEISQQDLDKYAKELLGNESPSSHSPRSKSPAPSAVSSSAVSSKIKSEIEKRKFSKSPTLPVKLRASDLRRKLSQEKQSCNNLLNSTPSKLATNVNSNVEQNTAQQPQSQQQDQKKCKRTYPSEQQSQIKKPNCYRKSSPKPSGYGFGGGVPPCDVNYVKIRHEMPNTPPQIEDENKEDSCSSPDQLNLLCDNTETLNMNCRPYSQSANKAGTIPKVQYSVTTKPHDFFTTNRKGSAGGNVGKVAIYNKHSELEEYDINVDSDDIKTDSDIDDGHFDKVEKEDEVSLSRKSSKTNRPSLSQVLNHLSLLTNSNVPEVTEQMLDEAKSTRANDERNRPFREPRRPNENSSERIVNLEENKRYRELREVYETESVTQLHRTISEESSDIKSDEDLVYSSNVSNHNHTTAPFNYCLGNGRFQ